MDILKTKIKDLLIIEPLIHRDSRGWFTETYSKREFESYGIFIDFVQFNHSMSKKKGTLRGLHFQEVPKTQTKLVRCTKGAILDVAVDLRESSKTYGEWVSVELTSDNKKQFLIPKGFAHGFVTLKNNTEVQYQVDEYYSPKHEKTIRYDDPDISIFWNVEEPILSKKDRGALYIRDTKINF
ncbi:MAG: dTDP-4-dehydrorhamnose 3,5-epimerase [Halanaerobiales bacterium]|nr:dTDP-4-dehydrorhamnose 3,5-epimerase [Halanaerobiales bacterium]